MLPFHGSRSKRWGSLKAPAGVVVRAAKSVSPSAWALILLMTTVNLFLFAYSAGLVGPGSSSAAKSEALDHKSGNKRAHSHGAHSHSHYVSSGRSAAHSYFSKDNLSRRKGTESPHDDLIRSKVVVATYAPEAYLYHVKTLVGSVQYWQSDFQVNVYYKAGATRDWGTKLEALMSLRAISLEEAVEDILAMRDEEEGRCSALLRGIGKTLDAIKEVAEREIGVFQPIVTLHSFCTSQGALGTLYVEPYMFLNGWVDIAVRSLQYDSHLMPCVDPSDPRNACLRGVQGYGSEEVVEEVLLPQVGCTVIGACGFLDRTGGGQSWDQHSLTAEGGGSWWTHKSPSYVVEELGGKCLNASGFMIESHQKVGDDLGLHGGEEENGASCLVGSTAQPYQCHLRYNPIADYTRFSGRGGRKRPRKGAQSVALGIVVHTPMSTLLSNPADMAALEGALATLRRDFESGAGFRGGIHAYVAFESGGSAETDSQAAKQIRYQLKLSLGLQDVEAFSVGNVDSISAASNLLFRQAMEDGHEYFVALSDAVKLVASPSGGESWLKLLVSKFEVPILPNFGVVAPMDSTNSRGLTCPLVHRTHHEVFGDLYPTHLTHYESQLWISSVYGYQHTYLIREVEVEAGKQGGSACLNEHVLGEAVSEGKREIAAWAQKVGGSTLDHIASSLSVQEL